MNNLDYLDYLVEDPEERRRRWGTAVDDASVAGARNAPDAFPAQPLPSPPEIPPAGVTIVKPEIFSFQMVESFLFKKAMPGKAQVLGSQLESFDLVQSDKAGRTARSTALEFSETGSTSALLAPNSAPEFLPDQSRDVQSLLRAQESRERRAFIA